MRKVLLENVFNTLVSALIAPSTRSVVKKAVKDPLLSKAMDEFINAKTKVDVAQTNLKREVEAYIKKHHKRPPEADYLDLSKLF